MKLTKFIVMGLFASTVLAGTGLSAEAAEVSATTNGTLDFKDSDGLPAPVDPTEDGKEPVVPVPPVSTTGQLRFDYLPTLNFGTVEIKGEKVVTPAQYVRLNDVDGTTFKKYTPAYLQVTDERGQNEGWSVSITATDFIAIDKTNSQPAVGGEGLAGAAITMKSATIKSHSGVTDALKPIVKATNTTLNNSSQQIIRAAEGTGMGIWTNSFYANPNGNLTAPPATIEEGTIPTDDTIELAIPGTAKKSKDYTYQATLSWILADTPDN